MSESEGREMLMRKEVIIEVCGARIASCRLNVVVL